MKSRAWAPIRVQKTPSKWTLAYHSASVHRSIPKVNSTNSAMSAATMTHRPTRRPRPIPAPSSGPPGRRRLRIGCGGGRWLVVGSSSVPSAVAVVVGSVSSDRPRASSGSSLVRVVACVRRLRGGSRLRLAPALRAGAAPPGSRRTGRASSAESSRYRPQGRWSKVRWRSGTRRGPSPRARSDASPRPARARSGTRRGWPGRCARDASGPRRGERAESHLEPAVVLEDQPGHRPGDRRAEAGQRRIGWRPGVGGDVAEADDRPRHRRPRRSPATSRPAHRRAGTCRRAAVGRRCGPRARAGTTDRAEGGVRARGQDSGRAARAGQAGGSPSVRVGGRPSRQRRRRSRRRRRRSRRRRRRSSAARGVGRPRPRAAASLGGQRQRVERGFRARRHRGDLGGVAAGRPCGPRARRRSGSRRPRPGGSRCRRRSGAAASRA